MILVNAAANLVITFSVAMFMIFVFGRSNMMQKIHWLESFIIKVGLAMLSSGSLLSLLTFSNPPISEIIVNIGLAIVFAWGAYFHFKYFVKK